MLRAVGAWCAWPLLGLSSNDISDNQKRAGQTYFSDHASSRLFSERSVDRPPESGLDRGYSGLSSHIFSQSWFNEKKVILLEGLPFYWQEDKGVIPTFVCIPGRAYPFALFFNKEASLHQLNSARGGGTVEISCKLKTGANVSSAFYIKLIPRFI